MWLVATVACSGTESEASKSTKVSVFSGWAKDHEAWWMRFAACTALVGFGAARMANLPATEEEVTGDIEEQKKARLMHNKARCFGVFAMVMQSSLHFMPNTVPQQMA